MHCFSDPKSSCRLGFYTPGGAVGPPMLNRSKGRGQRSDPLVLHGGFHRAEWLLFSRHINHFALFCGNFVSSKLNHRKKNEIFHLSQRARDLDYVVNKLTVRSKDLISSYIDLNVGGVGSLFVIEESKSARCSLLLRCQHVPEISSAARILVLKIDKILRWSKSNSILEPPINLPPFPDCFSVYMKTPENEIFYIHKRRHLVDTKR